MPQDQHIHVWGIPLDSLMPPIFAFGANVVSGVTNFGDGVFFIICWNLFGEFGPVNPDKYTYIDAILYSSMLPLASIPALVYAARTEMWLTNGYGLAHSATAAFSSVLGVWFLLYVNPSVAEDSAGVLFCIFTAWKLIPAMLDLGIARRRKTNGAPLNPDSNTNPMLPQKADGLAKENGGDDEGGGDDDGADDYGDNDKPELDESETILVGAGANVHWKSMGPYFEKYPGLKGWVERWFPQVSEMLVPVETVALALLVCGLAAGFLGGLIGTGSPAQLVVFVNLDMTKGSMRGVKVQATIVSNVIRLLAIAFSGSNAFEADMWPVYLAVCVCSLAGCTFGTWLRLYVNKDWLMVLLYMLLWLTSADLMKVETNLTTNFAFLFYVATGALLFATVACYVYPTWVEHTVASLRSSFSFLVTEKKKTKMASVGGRASVVDGRMSIGRGSIGRGSTARGSSVRNSRVSIVRDLDEWEG